MKKPKTLYYYQDYALGRHKVTSECVPQQMTNFPDGSAYWRCRSGNHDFYGYDTIRGAKNFEIAETRLRLNKDQWWLKKLQG